MENKLFFYNTLTRTVERFVPNEDGQGGGFGCGG